MSLTAIPLLVPVYCMPVIGYHELNAQDERIAACGFWPTPDGASRSITAIGWWTTNITDADDVLVQIESLSSGLPNGIIAAGASGTKSVGAGDDNVWLEQALTTPYTMSSSWLAVTLKMTGTGKTQRHASIWGYAGSMNNLLWGATDIAGAATWVNANTPWNCALKTSLGEWITPFGMASQYTSSHNISTAPTNPYYVGNKISSSVSVRLCGAFMPYMDMDQGIKIHLMDVSGNILLADDASTAMTITAESTYRYGTSAQYNAFIAFPKYKTLAASTNYYLMYEPATGTNQPVISGIFNDTTIKSNTARIPSGWTVNYVTSPQSWSITETDTRITGLYPVFDQMDMGSGSGGGGGIWMPRPRQIGV